MRVRIKVRIFPTEDINVILSSLNQLFPGVQFKVSSAEVYGEGGEDVLNEFRERIRRRRIRNTIEDTLLSNWNSGKTWIRINKQDAVNGVVNLSESSPLGDIVMEIEVPRDGIHALVWGNEDGG